MRAWLLALACFALSACARAHSFEARAPIESSSAPDSDIRATHPVRERRPDWGYVGIGAAVMAISIGANTVAARVFQDEGAWPLHIPGAGPFVAMGTLDHVDGNVAEALLLDFLVQGVSTTTFIIAWCAGVESDRSDKAEKREKRTPFNVTLGPGSLGTGVSF